MTEGRGEEREREREGSAVMMEIRLFQCPSFDSITSETASWEGINSTMRTHTESERDVVDDIHRPHRSWTQMMAGRGISGKLSKVGMATDSTDALNNITRTRAHTDTHGHDVSPSLSPSLGFKASRRVSLSAQENKIE